MKRIALALGTLSVVGFAANAPTGAATLESSVDIAQRAIDQQQFKKAETTLKRAIEMTASGSDDNNLVKAHVLLARAQREGGKYTEAAASLDGAHNVYKKLGYVEPQYVEELNALTANFQQIDLANLRSAANVLKNNSAVVSMAKSGAGGHVEIAVAAPFENSVASAKVDGVQLDKLVAFDIEQQAPGQIHISNIKGFKIHAVEKNTWANLLELTTTGSVDAEGKYDATIVAGKGGFTKTVAAKLPAKAFEPLSGFADQLSKFGTVAAVIDLPVVAAKPKAESTTAATAPVAETNPVIETKPVAVETTPVVQIKPVAVEAPPAVETKPVVEAKPVVEGPDPSRHEAATQTTETKAPHSVRTSDKDDDNDRDDKDDDNDKDDHDNKKDKADHDKDD